MTESWQDKVYIQAEFSLNLDEKENYKNVYVLRLGSYIFQVKF